MTLAYSSTTASPIGELRLFSDGAALIEIAFESGPARAERGRVRPDPELAVLRDTAEQLAAYFVGDLLRFDLPRAAAGTDFQRRVWDALCEVPLGETQSYAEIAHRIGSPRAARAVGAANGRNPIPVVVPCHRIVGTGGALVGYAGGLDRKRFLLEHERKISRAPIRYLRVPCGEG